MRQTLVPVHSDCTVQRFEQAPFTQSWPVEQCAEVLQVPAGRGLQRPPWQESAPRQSVSAEQPKKQVAFTHQAPRPQSALKVQVVGTPASVAVPPPWFALPPPVPDVPPPVPEVPPPVPAVPPAVAAPPPVPAEPPPTPAEPPAVPPSAVTGGFAQKPLEQTRLPPQSIAELHGRTQYPLMQGSRPHCAFELQVRAPGGIARQLPARQKLPVEQSAFCVHAATQRLATHVVPLEHCELLVHFGLGVQRPD